MVCGLLIEVAYFVGKHNLQGAEASVVTAHGLTGLERGLSNCGRPARLPLDMWTLSRPAIEPVSPILADRFLTIRPSAKSLEFFFFFFKDSSLFFRVFSCTKMFSYLFCFVLIEALYIC